MSSTLRTIRSLVFNRITIGTFLALWAVAVAGFLWLASGTMPRDVALVYDVVFIKLLNVPGLVIVSTLFPDAVDQSPVALVFVVSLGYVLVALLVSISYRAVRRGRRSIAST